MVQKKSNSAKASSRASARSASTAKASAAARAQSAKALERRKKTQLKEKPSDKAFFKEQLLDLNLRVEQVTADGNCFFRAVADQLEGNESNHSSYRERVVDLIESRREDFEPFVEDDVPFDKYCRNMREDATWAGHLELQAASLLLQCNICIHQVREPRWNIINFDTVGTRTLHLSYHDGVHYNSVRRIDDPGRGPALPITIDEDCVSHPSTSGKTRPSSSASVSERSVVDVVCVGSGCMDREKAEAVLSDMGGNVDSAIEYLIAERNAELEQLELRTAANPLEESSCITSVSQDGAGLSACGSAEDAEDGGGMQQSEVESRRVERGGEGDEHRNRTKLPGPTKAEPACSAPSASAQPGKRKDASGGEKGANARKAGGSAKEGAEEPKASRNKPCPCGSKKKFKSCCGVEPGRAPSNAHVKHLTNKGRKEQQRSQKTMLSSQSLSADASAGFQSSSSADLGSLCI